MQLRSPASSGARVANVGTPHNGISIDAWYYVLNGLLAPEAPAIPPAAPIIGAGTHQLQGRFPDRLSEPSSRSEVALALKRLRRNKAAGVDGIRAEHLLDAQAMLLEPMTDAFTHLLLVEVPECLRRVVIHPVSRQAKGQTSATIVELQ